MHQRLCHHPRDKKNPQVISILIHIYCLKPQLTMPFGVLISFMSILNSYQRFLNLEGIATFVEKSRFLG